MGASRAGPDELAQVARCGRLATHALCDGLVDPRTLSPRRAGHVRPGDDDRSRGPGRGRCVRDVAPCPGRVTRASGSPEPVRFGGHRRVRSDTRLLARRQHREAAAPDEGRRARMVERQARVQQRGLAARRGRSTPRDDPRDAASGLGTRCSWRSSTLRISARWLFPWTSPIGASEQGAKIVTSSASRDYNGAHAPFQPDDTAARRCGFLR